MFVYNDDDLIIGTPRYEEYQRLFSEAGKRAFLENKGLGIPNVYVEKDNAEKKDGALHINSSDGVPKKMQKAKKSAFLFKILKNHFLFYHQCH